MYTHVYTCQTQLLNATLKIKKSNNEPCHLRFILKYNNNNNNYTDTTIHQNMQ